MPHDLGVNLKRVNCTIFSVATSNRKYTLDQRGSTIRPFATCGDSHF
jgi:hypothetical protein